MEIESQERGRCIKNVAWSHGAFLEVTMSLFLSPNTQHQGRGVHACWSLVYP